MASAAPPLVIPLSVKMAGSTLLPAAITPAFANGFDSIQIGSNATVPFVVGNVLTVTINAYQNMNLMITLKDATHIATLYQGSSLVATLTGTTVMTNLASISSNQVYTLRIYVGVAVPVSTNILNINTRITPIFTNFFNQIELQDDMNTMVNNGDVQVSNDTFGNFIFTFTNIILTSSMFDNLGFMNLLSLFQSLLPGQLNIVASGQIATYLTNRVFSFTGGVDLIAAIIWDGTTLPTTPVSGQIMVSVTGVGIPVMQPAVLHDGLSWLIPVEPLPAPSQRKTVKEIFKSDFSTNKRKLIRTMEEINAI